MNFFFKNQLNSNIFFKKKDTLHIKVRKRIFKNN